MIKLSSRLSPSQVFSSVRIFGYFETGIETGSLPITNPSTSSIRIQITSSLQDAYRPTMLSSPLFHAESEIIEPKLIAELK